MYCELDSVRPSRVGGLILSFYGSSNPQLPINSIPGPSPINSIPGPSPLSFLGGRAGFSSRFRIQGSGFRILRLRLEMRLGV